MAIGFSDDFSEDALGGPASTWNVVSGNWLVCENEGVHAYRQSTKTDGESLNGETSWNDYTVEAAVVDPKPSSTIVGLIGRAESSTRYYELQLRHQINGIEPYWYLTKLFGGKITTLASGPILATEVDPNISISLTFAGPNITASIAYGGEDYEVLSTVADTSIASGQVGLRLAGATSVANVKVMLPSSALPGESAISSDAFVDSMGMNAQIEEPSYANFSTVQGLVSKLGVRHYRVSAGLLQSQADYVSKLTSLHAASGIKFDVLSDLFTTSAQVVQAVGMLPAGSVDTVEGPNESDNPQQGKFYDPNYATDVPAYMQALYSAIKSDSKTSGIGVIGPSMVNSTSYSAIGGVASYSDFGNMHNYFAGFNPGTNGWGGDGYIFAPKLYYGSIDWNIASAGQATGSKPVYSTETGYYTAPVHSSVPLDVQAKYVPRLYLEQYLHHVPHTYMFQLIGYDTTTGEGSLDIVSPSYVPSPSYYSLAGMIALLSEGGRSSNPVTYNWALTGDTTNVAHLLLHKADGTLLIPLWIELPSYDVNANAGVGARISVSPQNVVVQVANTSGTATIFTCDPNTGAWASKLMHITNGAITMVVSDSVSVVQISAASQNTEQSVHKRVK